MDQYLLIQRTGISAWSAEALDDENDGPSEERLALMSEDEILDEILTWHGIVGYTSRIREAVKDAQTIKEKLGG
jgi:hypothetical protein